MRPAQQNRRMRGRGNNNNNNNNNRKGPNPLSRNYESNGPDVKIRGNAQHIAEKYTTLARDAQASGDRVIAENYLQHAEHYNRIIMAAMAQQNIPYQREENFDNDGGDEDENENGFVQAASAPQPVNGSGPQPVIEGTPAEVVYGDQGSENRSENRSQPRDGRDQRRLGRGRRPQRERFNSEDTSEQPSVETPIAAADEQPAPVSAPVVEKPARAEKPAKVVVEEAAPVVEKAAPAAEAPVAASAEEEAPVRRTTRRPGRPRRVAKDEGAGDTPVAETADSDA
ncbi:DUF4167 domain-containing protein [Ochrobactrum sp. MYb15]|uniref:DUF4167 domain-containing protein n=1 Tax=Brucella TaxID=234 RepID=UPI000467801F|nr:DUF4167 domain-containing protein [Brucella rhizosphaerae]PQZ46413.1 DUF4167 domain-containing protein [Ochrobactrum sp. MYb19]PRA60387.1 DUF4167 domain-containing protein [Ochrobactrum sp. MYb18]PRA77613.1 DUF4167 domain-containing protein [Brucella thiophenivorans]PRA85008.1 DUF4167 domain-containing protein [Ochrobactrum sp. MYb14]PRA99623.1 DUF4167 domain-containing protein [Ochrobactrum sp. MYb15]